MSVDKVHVRHCILYEFEQGRNAVQAYQNLLKVFGDDAVSERTCRNRFQKFKAGDRSLEDRPRSGRPSAIDDDILLNILKENPFLTSSEIAEKLNVAQQTVSDHIQRLGLVYKYSQWVPKELTISNLSTRVTICSSLLCRNKREPFLHHLVTGDEKWISFDNVVRKKGYCQPGQSLPTTSKVSLHVRKRMLCIWWDIRGPIYYELLKPNETINSDKYCQMLEKLEVELKKKRPALVNRNHVILQHDNARPHVSVATQKKIAELGWEVLSHPPYSPDIAPSDYHLFLSIQNFLNGKKFEMDDDVKMELEKFFESKDELFYQNGILKLPSRWEQIVNNNGNYFMK